MVQIKVDKSCSKLIFIIYLLTLSVTGLDQGAEEGSLGTCETVLWLLLPHVQEGPLVLLQILQGQLCKI